MPSINHLHMYERVKGSKTQFRCTHPTCSHTITKELLVGKQAMCAKCVTGKFIVTREALRRKSVWCCNQECPNLTGRKPSTDEATFEDLIAIEVVEDLITK